MIDSGGALARENLLLNGILYQLPNFPDHPVESGSSYHNKCPKTLHPRAQDAYLLFQVNKYFDMIQ